LHHWVVAAALAVVALVIATNEDAAITRAAKPTLAFLIDIYSS
jgi:hypothetical protein